MYGVFYRLIELHSGTLTLISLPEFVNSHITVKSVFILYVNIITILK